jgi:hypothetical protein
MPSKRVQGTIQILREHGPLAIEEVGRRLALAGATKARDPVRVALEVASLEPRAFRCMDGRWLDRVAALEGGVLLHRVTVLERRRAAIRMDPDLSVLSSLVRRPWGHWDGAADATVSLGWVRDRRLDRRHAAPDRFLAIPYALAREMCPGDMVRTIVTEGSLAVERAPRWRDPGDVGYPELEAVAGALLASGPGEDLAEPVAIEQLVFELLGRAPDALRALREPVGAMLHRVGLATHREDAGTAAMDWQRHERWQDAVVRAVDEAWEARDERRGHGLGSDLDLDPDPWEEDLHTG